MTTVLQSRSPHGAGVLSASIRRRFQGQRKETVRSHRARAFLLAFACLLSAGSTYGQVAPPAGRGPDTLSTVQVWAYTWPAARQDSVVHRLRMSGGGFLVYNFAYTLGAREGAKARLDWIAAPLKRVHSVTFTLQPYGTRGRPIKGREGAAHLVVPGPLDAATVPIRGGSVFATLPYGLDVTCLRFSNILVLYMDGTARSFSGRKLRGFFSDAVPNTCRAPARPVAALTKPVKAFKDTLR